MMIRSGNPASSEPDEARCIVCRQPYEPHPDALDRVIAAWGGAIDDGFCPHCRDLISMTPDEHARYMAASDAEIRAAIDRYAALGEPLPEPAREWLARQNAATDQAERRSD